MKNEVYIGCSMFVIFILNSCQAHSIQKDPNLFDRDRVHKIDIRIDSTHLKEIMMKPFEKIIHPAKVWIHFEETVDSIPSVGFRIKGNASRANGKKSFKLDINEYDKTQQYRGMDKINLNGFWNDPTHIRSLLVTEAFESLNIPVSDQGFCEVYINDKYFGFYNMVENVDREFIVKHYENPSGNLYKCIGLGNLIYPAENKDTFSIESAQLALKTNKRIANYSAFYHFLDVLNNSSDADFACEFEKVFDIESYIKILAVDFITGNWDSYAFSKNNYYLYHNPATNKFEYIPFDFDNSFGMDWVGENWAKKDIYNWHNPNYKYNHPDFESHNPRILAYKSQIEMWMEMLEEGPLHNRIMAIDEYRALYVFYLDKLVHENLNPKHIERRAESLMTFLNPYLERDDKDNFAKDQIALALDSSIVDLDGVSQEFHNYLLYGIKPFINASVDNVLNQIQDKIWPVYIQDGKLNWEPCVDTH